MEKQYDKSSMGRLVICVFAIAAAGYLILLYWVNQRVVAVDVSGCQIVEEGEMEYQIEPVRYQYHSVEISGYAYERGISTDKAATAVLAYDPVADVYYQLPTENRKDKSITKNANDGYNYDYAKFCSVALRKKIPDGSRICIWYRGNGANKLIKTEEALYY